MRPEFEPIIDRLRDAGIRGYFQQPNQLVLSLQQGPPWPDRGNSFWICCLDGTWYACTWAPLYYRVPDLATLLVFCPRFVKFGDRVQAEVPAAMVAEFKLTQISDVEFDALWAADQKSV